MYMYSIEPLASGSQCTLLQQHRSVFNLVTRNLAPNKMTRTDEAQKQIILILSVLNKSRCLAVGATVW